MTEITREVRLEVMRYADDSAINEGLEPDSIDYLGFAQEVYKSVMSVLDDINRDDELNGTNNLYTLLYSSESQSIRSIVEDRLQINYDISYR